MAEAEGMSPSSSPSTGRAGKPAMPTARRPATKRNRIVLLMIPCSLAFVLATFARQFRSGMLTLAPSGDVGASLILTMDEREHADTFASGRNIRSSKESDKLQGTTVVASNKSPSRVAFDCDPPGFDRNRSFTGDDEDLCLRQLAETLARVWKSKPKSEWCPASYTQLVDVGNSTHVDRTAGGIVLIKVPKSASSTVAGMALHSAAAAEASSSSSAVSSPFSACHVEWEHARASESPTLRSLDDRGGGTNSSRPFLLVAPIRDPLTRALSDVYYHQVSLGSGARKSPQDSFVIRQLNRVQPNYILQYISPRKVDAVSSSSPSDNPSLQGFNSHHPPFRIPRNLVEQVRSAVQLYDFWVVVDRFAESVVVLSNLTETSWHQYMTMPSKVGGSYYRSSPSRCVQLVSPVMTPRVLQHAKASWNSRNLGDWLLYHVANASLDQTIDSIGRDWVVKQVQDVRAFQNHIRVACAIETYFPCSPTGQVQAQQSMESCYARDFGCGHACVRRESQRWESNRNA